jgi:hypothetical protein
MWPLNKRPALQTFLLSVSRFSRFLPSFLFCASSLLPLVVSFRHSARAVQSSLLSVCIPGPCFFLALPNRLPCTHLPVIISAEPLFRLLQSVANLQVLCCIVTSENCKSWSGDSSLNLNHVIFPSSCMYFQLDLQRTQDLTSFCGIVQLRVCVCARAVTW